MSARKPNGRFAPGVSGNPAGRPPSASAELRKQLAEQSPALASKALEMALAGDVQALRLCLDKLVPSLKPQAEPVAVDLPTDAGIAGTARAFIDAAARGELSPDTAQALVAAVTGLARVVELDEIDQRLADIEAQIQEQSK